MLDASVLNKLAEVIEKATDKRRLDVDPTALQQLKFLCKASDENVRSAFDLLLDRLKAQDAQTRLHALEVCNLLFARSRAFRTAAAAQFPALLEASIGFRPARPLPGPTHLATQLRERALDAVERWNDNYGVFYQQARAFHYSIRLGVRYLKGVLKMKFPELRARAAAAEAEARRREERAQQILQAKYRRIVADFGAGTAEIQSVLDQVHRCFELLRADSPPAQPPPRLTSAPADEEDWEDVDADKDMDAADEAEGLADYGATEAPEELLTDAAAYGGVPLLGRAPDPAVLENLHALQRELVNRHLPTLQEWLRVMVKADVGEAGSEEHTERERLMREAVNLRSGITLAQDRYGVLKSILPDQALTTSAISPTDKAPVMPAGQHLHYWDSADEANALVNMRGMELQNHWGPVNANATLPPERLSALFGTVATYYTPPEPQGKSSTPLPPPELKEPALKPPLRKPPGKTLVGPSAAQLLASRFGGNAAAPSGAQQQLGAPNPAAASSVPDTLLQRRSDGIVQKSEGGAAAQIPLISSASIAPLHQPSTAAAAAGRSPAAAARTAAAALPGAGSAAAQRPSQAHQWPAAAAAAAAMGNPGAHSERQMAAAAAGSQDAHSERPGRAQAAADRAHNAAVLAEAALSSEAMARLLHEQELRGARRGTGASRNGRTTGVKRKLGVRDRLARKLLSGRAAAATAGELAAADAESHRDRMSNRWEEV
ncbi:hypothetical protein COCSUDRAFT_45128 [Coccomyxa subellipsoidea C-169]|uniref:VHS domain-containing protein n=1 Tax=Coccomyxa subellipsoidea (strain C-169) TaxID=574566 RepID=I0YJR0_COCSC|nr:hypothetical protein COCSUDRAFT_45128 [Coccomyxa subellipsoidea C-169]EIE18629.1 hypothetical protein COCSUDRAFT_45128 [Coccomyxa subellipsoidea C-169]|eukprot:XP_005643173.1 hypothetical protein COCSUDRAFT_45128 [Coccomyxa subellipsoidea C-169]